MRDSETKRLALGLIAFLVVLGGLPFLKGGFYIGKHEGDAMHMAEIVLRIAGGEWPHLDFMTPIGVLAMAPIAWFVMLGAGIGHAIFLAQALAALAVLPAVLWVARSRLGPVTGWLYGAYVMILCVALVHGEAEQSVSISMHYNRWAWAIAYAVLPLALLAPRDGRVRAAADGIPIGLGLAALVLIKVTYFISLAPAILIALLARRWWATVLWAAVAGLAAAALVTAFAGPAFWLAYARDLATVAGSEVRPAPGLDFHEIAASPLHIGASLALLATIIFLRQSGRMIEGMALLFLMPGFLYITYQNFGNDPQWLILVAVFAPALRPAEGTVNGRGWDMRQCLTYAGLAAVAFGFASLVNLAYSPIRHQLTRTEKFAPLLSALPQHGDMLAGAARIYGVIETHQGDGPGTPFAAYAAQAEKPDKAVLNGEELGYCEQLGGIVAWFEWVAADLERAGFAGSRLMSADYYSSYWIYGDFPPVKGGAPWYYGGLPGIENVDYIVVPTCPVGDSVRTMMLKSLADAGYRLTEVRRTPVYRLIAAER